MITAIIAIVITVIMIAGCLFVNDTRKKHGVCCGKACAGCPTFEEERRRQLHKTRTDNSNSPAE